MTAEDENLVMLTMRVEKGLRDRLDKRAAELGITRTALVAKGCELALAPPSTAASPATAWRDPGIPDGGKGKRPSSAQAKRDVKPITRPSDKK